MQIKILRVNTFILIGKIGKLKSKMKAKVKFKKAQRTNQGKGRQPRSTAKRPPLPNVAVPAKKTMRGDRRASCCIFLKMKG